MLSMLKQLNQILWGTPFIVLLLGTHLFFTIKTRGVQRQIKKAIHYSISPSEGTQGLSGFATLTATLAATLGTGNIIGISTAIYFGGPGAIFWCWVAGLLGMATTYAECYLGMLYREKQQNGTYIGGPMYIIKNGLPKRFPLKKQLALLYAFCTLAASFGVGCATQANSLGSAVVHLLEETTSFTSSFGRKILEYLPEISGLLAALIVGFVIIGGAKSIGKVCTILVPAMGAFYLLACFLILIQNKEYLISSLLLIVKRAILPNTTTTASIWRGEWNNPVLGGILGASLQQGLRYGIARGLFTNEAGLGSASIAAAQSNLSDPKRQALISMTATFWDTVVMCALTGIVIVTNLLKYPVSLADRPASDLVLAAFEQIPVIGSASLHLSLIAFAIATLIGWSYFGERAFCYLFGETHVKYYQIAYLVMIFIGTILSLELVWELTDCINVFMAIPNLIALFALHKKISNP